MMYSGKKFLLFSLLGILLGYLFHRLTLLYDSYTGNSLDKWTHLLKIYLKDLMWIYNLR